MGEENTVEENIQDEGGAPEAAEQNTGTAEGGEDTSQEESDTPKVEAPLQEKEPPKEEEDEEPPTRKPRTPADWVALRRQRKIEREKRKALESKGEDDEEAEEDTDVSPEDAKIIDARVRKHLEPIIKEREEQILKSDIANFIQQNPEFKQYAAKAEKWAKHPSWENVPTEQLMYAIAGKDLLKIGAERKAVADAKARQTKVAGGSASNAQTTKPVWEMTDEEFAKQVERVKLGQK